MNSGLYATFFHCHLPPSRLFLIAKVTRTCFVERFLDDFALKYARKTIFRYCNLEKKTFLLLIRGAICLKYSL